MLLTKLNKKNSFLFFFIFTFFINAQDVSIVLEKANKKYIYFEIFDYLPVKEALYAHDVSSDTIKFKFPVITSSIYKIYIHSNEGKVISTDFLVEPNKNLNFVWNTEKNEATFSKSSINDEYQSRLKNLNINFQKIITISTFIEKYTDKDDLLTAAIDQKSKSEKEFEKLILDYNTGEEFINILFKGIRYKQPALNNFFLDLPLSNSTWYSTPRSYEQINSYFNLFKNENSKLPALEYNKLLTTNLIENFKISKSGLVFLKDFAKLNWKDFKNESVLKLLSEELLKINDEFKKDKELVEINNTYGKYTVNNIFPLKDFIAKEPTKKDALLIFMSSYCDYCSKAFDQLKQFKDDLKEVEIILVSTEKEASLNKEKVNNWKKDNDFNFQWVQNDQLVPKIKEIIIFGTPTYFFLKKEADNSWKIIQKRGFEKF